MRIKINGNNNNIDKCEMHSVVLWNVVIVVDFFYLNTDKNVHVYDMGSDSYFND